MRTNVLCEMQSSFLCLKRLYNLTSLSANSSAKLGLGSREVHGRSECRRTECFSTGVVESDPGAAVKALGNPPANSRYQEAEEEPSSVSSIRDGGLLRVDTLTHVDDSGKATMVNVTEKAETRRVAVASSRVILGPTAFQLVAKNNISKGDVLTVAKIAGIQGAKQTSNLIPLCHNILLSGVDVSLALNEALHAVEIRAEVTTLGRTGVEMEALTAVSVASLTVYDMCKAVSKNIQIGNMQLQSKTGGKSGDWYRE